MDFWNLASQYPCHLCRSFKPSRHLKCEGSPTLYSRHYEKNRELRDVVESARRGCPGCSLLYDALKAWNSAWIEDNVNAATIRLSLMYSVLSVEINYVRGGFFQLLQAQEVNNYEPTKPCFSTYDIIPNTTKPKAFDRARSWLRNCMDNHVCGHSENDAWMPSRVLDINTRGLDQGDYVYLVQSPSEKAHYTALSYCWGKDLEGVTRTLRDNLAAHMGGIPIDILPQTIQDAVTVSRGLHIRYLWVDSLCIVQDDVEDWEREAAMMSAVYQCAHVTICAHAAISCKDGFLGSQVYGQPEWQKSLWTSFESSPNNHTEFQFFVRQGEHDFRKGTLRSALNTRGWALQESVLSSRILHFTGNEMAWQCDSAHFCECGHVGGFERYNKKSMTKTQDIDAKRNLRRAPEADYPSSNMDAWKTLVERYSRRRLTYDRDKLVAIEGLAKMCGSAGGAKKKLHSAIPDYIFGIFSANIIDQLMWFVKDGPEADSDDDDQIYTSLDQKRTNSEGNPNSKGFTYPLGEESRGNTSSLTRSVRRLPLKIAPTWSWASIDGQINYIFNTYNGIELKTLADVVASNEFDVPLGLGGTLRSRDLIVQGIVVPVALKTVKNRLFKDKTWTGNSTFVRAADGKAYECLMDIERDVPIKVTDPAYACWVQGHEMNETLHQYLEIVDAASQYSSSEEEQSEPSSVEEELLEYSYVEQGLWEYSSEDEEEPSEVQRGQDSEIESQGSLQSTASDVYNDANLGGELDMTSESEPEFTSDESSQQSEYGYSESSESDCCSWCKLCEGDKPEGHETDYCCLQMAKARPDPESGIVIEIFLVLRQSTQVPGTWERIGIGHGLIEDENDGEGSESPFKGGDLQQLRLV